MCRYDRLFNNNHILAVQLSSHQAYCDLRFYLPPINTLHNGTGILNFSPYPYSVLVAPQHFFACCCTEIIFSCTCNPPQIVVFPPLVHAITTWAAVQSIGIFIAVQPRMKHFHVFFLVIVCQVVTTLVVTTFIQATDFIAMSTFHRRT